MSLLPAKSIATAVLALACTFASQARCAELAPLPATEPGDAPRAETLPSVETREAEVEAGVIAPAAWDAADAPEANPFEVGYADGVYLRAQRERDSFELKGNLRTQFRFVSFTRDAETWVDSAGIVRPIENRQTFDIERARLILSGHAFTPQLKYLLQTDGDTDSRHELAIIDHWWAWHFSDALEVQVGKRKAPGTRNWLLGAFDTRLVDRPFANEFFRPSRTTGVWVVGDPAADWHYELMVGQGYNTEGLTPSELSDQFAGAASAWCDLVGSYGPARPADFEFHEELAIRTGGSLVSSREGRPGSQLEEADFLRLTDGTRLTEPGALAPGATVESFDVTLVALDTAFKYRGWSANGEYFWRRIDDVRANLPVPTVGLQQGFYVEGGVFLLPQELEANSHLSYVTGGQGSRTGGAMGISYYPRRSQHLKLSLDVTVINGSPVNSTGSDILVGDEGVLVRTQFQAVF